MDSKITVSVYGYARSREMGGVGGSSGRSVWQIAERGIAVRVGLFR